VLRTRSSSRVAAEEAPDLGDQVNGISITMPYWDERFEAMAQYPDVRTDKFHIDILTAHFVQHPDWFDVVVASNLFGDILSDLGPACTGTIGIAPSANINPERTFPSLFEPVHGSRAGHRRQGHRQSDRADLERLADARRSFRAGGVLERSLVPRGCSELARRTCVLGTPAV
jgi:hypothetical protein